MFDALTSSFRKVRENLQGHKTLDEGAIDDTLKEIRRSMLAADVEIHVVRAFLDRVKETALGEVVRTTVKFKGQKHRISPGDQFIKICHSELINLMSSEDAELAEGTDGLTRIMMVGLQGSGKTTTAAKLAHLFQREDRRPMLVAADIYRPAAVDQLRVLGERLGVPVFHEPGLDPPEICVRGVQEARASRCDVVIFDTAGRLTIDQQLMDELGEIQTRTRPENTLLVIDAMIGQDAVRTAKAFHERVPIEGVVLTKLDGDARGGAALSVKEVTGRPILFAGTGEALHKLERFRAEGLADRILGFGDIVGLVQDFERVVDAEQAERDAERMLRGQFTFHDFLEQLRAIKQMGSLKDLFEKLPFFNEVLPENASLDDREIVRIEAMIQSMTKQERKQPELLEDESRARRVARGSGRAVRDVQDLYVRFRTMRDLMGALGKQPGLLGRIPGFRQIGKLAKLKNMDLSEFFGGAGGGPMAGGEPRPKKPPVALKRMDSRSARKARKALRRKTRKRR